ncbi:GNAT family N-acetyltransferase [Pontibacillus sp. HMF3514]|uniref:GNAT family N-acetyltransferase n=1 Tax=Pontibacillus sp. HMF3514 TaxID=2692425 RepID=UPI0013200966|nr:N-acetyltransferase [Pontibacillus sp. HMF3514]QHE54049.1 GNAT family N-acetyltransferase [Pontibacillus sp. HMF3514]
MHHIRQENEEDINEVKEVNDLAFNQEDEFELIERLRDSNAFIPELSLVAVNNENNVIGHILFTRISIENEGRSVPSLALAPMAVHPHFQKKGIGGSLINEGIKRAKSLGFESVVVLGHDQYYPKFGFLKASHYNIEAPFDVPDEAFMVQELKENALQHVEGTVRYSTPFME